MARKKPEIDRTTPKDIERYRRARDAAAYARIAHSMDVKLGRVAAKTNRVVADYEPLAY